MGGCCSSCFAALRGEGDSSSSGRRRETELSNVGGKSMAADRGGPMDEGGLTVSRPMSSPSIRVVNDGGGSSGSGNTTITGSGLVLIGVNVEQDAAYWEWHIHRDGLPSPSSSGKKGGKDDRGGDGAAAENGEENGEDDDLEDWGFEDEADALRFGVSTRKSPRFYEALGKAELDGEEGVDDGLTLLRPIPDLRDGDTIGIAVQQSDLPMIQFLLNGEPLHDLAINRFRGAVYPAAYLPPTSEEKKNATKITAVFDENDFREMSPHARFGPLIAARGII